MKRKTASIFTVATLAVFADPSLSQTIDGITLGAPIPANITPTNVMNSEAFDRGFFSDGETWQSIELDEGLSLTAISDGPDGPVMAIFVTLYERSDPDDTNLFGLISSPDAIESYPIEGTDIVLGQTTLQGVYDRFGPSVGATPELSVNTNPVYRLAMDAERYSGSNAPILVSFGTPFIGDQPCLLKTLDDPECANSKIRTLYLVNTSYTPPFYMGPNMGLYPLPAIPEIASPFPRSTNE